MSFRNHRGGMKISRVMIMLLAVFTLSVAFAAGKVVKMNNGLVYEDVKIGTGQEAVSGKTVVVDYTGWLNEGGKKGKQFDSSIGREKFSFLLGGGMVIKGWDEGVAGMKIGGERRLMIPANLGYGSRGAGTVIPPNADLIFDVTLYEVK